MPGGADDETNGAEAAAEAAAAAASIREEEEKRREGSSSRCFFCCCHYRGAVIVSSLLWIAYYGTLMVLAGLGSTFLMKFGEDVPDHSVEFYGVARGSKNFAIHCAFWVVFGIYQLLGALYRNDCVLGLCLLIHLVYIGLNIWWIRETIAAFLPIVEIGFDLVVGVYPLVFLILEIRAGIA